MKEIQEKIEEILTRFGLQVMDEDVIAPIHETTAEIARLFEEQVWQTQMREAREC